MSPLQNPGIGKNYRSEADSGDDFSFFINGSGQRKGATTAQDTLAPKDDAQFLVFEWKEGQPYSAHGDWLKRNRAVFDHADYCTLNSSRREVGPHSSGRGSGVYNLSSFLVVREVDEYGIASRSFHDEQSRLDIKVSFEFTPAIPPDPVNKKGFPPQVFMSLSVHRGKDDAKGDIERSQVGFLRYAHLPNGLTLTKRALVGETEHRYTLGCSDPRETLRAEEQLSRVRRKH